ncbi:protein farnesyltransferase subunit beta-like [Branchiostoma lanceolatum]|uniref:protein farnesyltransferase subunit beta-like n=1 Tax=Branchiostoma lanceolatum TaxID=7740 RepID=UPI0034559CDA
MALRSQEGGRNALRFEDDDLATHSSLEQEKVEESVEQLYSHFHRRSDGDADPVLHREKHLAYLKKGLRHLSDVYECLDASRPWLCYWIVHGLELLEEPMPEETASEIAQFLSACQHPNGGFGGGPGQLAHLAPTYAAVNALCILGTEEAYNVIDRPKLQRFLLSAKRPDGAWLMHEGGEEDVRGAYCAASAATLTNIITPEMFEGTPEWIVRCQTYEGGIAGVPEMEAHGGYTFCGYAALVMLGRERLIDTKSLLRWTVNRQMRLEGGFQGRTNKLVDGCYSFWQAGTLPLLHRVLMMEGDEALSKESWMFHQGALQEYVLICCQFISGGLIDKPGKARDFYHTCYCLSGLSIAQHFIGGKYNHSHVMGPARNELHATHPVYNISPEAVVQANSYFGVLPVPSPNSAS